MSHCKDCDAESDLAPCTVCKAWICPKHRAGTGDLRDGYCCLEHPFGFIPQASSIAEEAITKPKKPEPKPLTEGVLILYVLAGGIGYLIHGTKEGILFLLTLTFFRIMRHYLQKTPPGKANPR
jgi:hypothetical protein